MSAPKGRPSIFNAELAAEICARIADGQSLRSICRRDDMPALKTVFLWLADPSKAEFLQQYTHARDAQADSLVEECIDIADDATNDWMVREGKNNETAWVLNGEHVQRSRLRVDTRKWWAARLAPKKYGDRLELDGSVETKHRVVSGVPLTESEWDKQYGESLNGSAGIVPKPNGKANGNGHL